MRKLAFAAVLALATPAAHAADNPLVGSWRLVSFVDRPAGHPDSYPFGERPIGLFVFTADGFASISIMRNPRDQEVPQTLPNPDASIPDWYVSYFGRYTVDMAAGVWVVDVEGSNIPSYPGTRQMRHFRLEGDTITVSGTQESSGTIPAATYERVLKRITPR